MARFARWSIMPMARVERGRCRTLIEFQDARFGQPGKGQLGQTVALPVHAAGC